MDLAERYRLARTLTRIEEQQPGWRELVAEAYRAEPRAAVIGVAGAPGVGKSTLIDGLASHWAAAGQEVAILAVDPSSPFSQGALLGDRIRMQRSGECGEVFMRSVAARGHAGGLATAIADFCAVLNHYGADRILLETIGTGQSDTEVVAYADCVLAVVAPGMGDGVQAAKAGWMETGDVYVVNKCDLAAAEEAEQTLRLHLASLYEGSPGLNAVGGSRAAGSGTPGRLQREHRHGDAAVEPFWHPPTIAAAARQARGVGEVAVAIDAFLAWTKSSGRGERARLERLEAQIAALVEDEVLASVRRRIGNGAGVASGARAVAAGQSTPHLAAETLVAQLGFASEYQSPPQRNSRGRGIHDS